MWQFTPIGVVENAFTDPAPPEEMRKAQSRIRVYKEYTDGLWRIEEHGYLQVVFLLDRSGPCELIAPRRYGGTRGVFASRSPSRPNPLGVSTVRLLERKENTLLVSGLDALDQTPVLDIKPYAPQMDGPPLDGESPRLEDPRRRISELIQNNDLRRLLLKAGELHGHYCPFLALGVKAGAYALKQLKTQSDGMEDTVAITETNSCFADGIQYATGCSLGNNGLIYRDFGKTAVTIARRGGGALRLHVRSRGEVLEKRYPQAMELFEKVVAQRSGTEEDSALLKRTWTKIAFDLIDQPAFELFDIQEVTVDIPDYAPIFDSRTCQSCGEPVMAPKAVPGEDGYLCRACARSSYLQLDGAGLTHVRP